MNASHMRAATLIGIFWKRQMLCFMFSVHYGATKRMPFFSIQSTSWISFCACIFLSYFILSYIMSSKMLNIVAMPCFVFAFKQNRIMKIVHNESKTQILNNINSAVLNELQFVYKLLTAGRAKKKTRISCGNNALKRQNQWKKPKSLCEHKKNTKFWNKKQPYQVKRTSTILPERPTAAVEYWCDVIARRPLINTNSSAQFAGPFYVRFHKQNLNAQSVATFARVNERKLKLFNCSGDFSLSLSLAVHLHLHHYHFGLA